MSKSTITDEEVFVLILAGAGSPLAAPWTPPLDHARTRVGDRRRSARLW